MNEIDVRIVRLEPMHVAMTYGFGQGPEEIAWHKMNAFVKEKGISVDGVNHRFFGFNNPDPTPGSPNYGYEQWVTIAPEMTVSGKVQAKDFEGGVYAVTRCLLSSITETWHALALWREKSPYRMGTHQWLEEALTPPVSDQSADLDAVLDLYLPILE
jgi:DNA gyrase inhibitor GyrI